MQFGHLLDDEGFFLASKKGVACGRPGFIEVDLEYFFSPDVTKKRVLGKVTHPAGSPVVRRDKKAYRFGIGPVLLSVVRYEEYPDQKGQPDQTDHAWQIINLLSFHPIEDSKRERIHNAVQSER